MSPKKKALVAALLAVRKGVLTTDQALKCIAASGESIDGLNEEEFLAMVNDLDDDKSIHQLSRNLISLNSRADPAKLLKDVEIVLRQADGGQASLLSLGLDNELVQSVVNLDDSFSLETFVDGLRSVEDQILEIRRTHIKALTDKGRYEVKKEIGRGGMGAVYLAYDTTLDRDVALKSLLVDDTKKHSRDSRETIEISERFLREARITGQLEHPNIPPIYEIAENPQGDIYYTMKFIQGVSLGKKLKEILKAREMELPPEKELKQRLALIPVFIDACNAMDYAHAKGMVHRDLKPDNIMVGDFGDTLVVDWGLAKAEGQDELDEVEEGSRVVTRAMLQAAREKAQSSKAFREAKKALSDTTSQSTKSGSYQELTLEGAILGTPPYMSPEQARGELDKMDARSDIYSLGAILFEILAGRPPIKGEDVFETLELAVDGKRKELLELAPDAPPELVAIVDKALAFQQTDRFQRCSEMTKELRAWQSGSRLSVYQYTSWELLRRFVRQNLGKIAAVIIVLLALGGVFGWMEWQDHQAYLDAVALREDAVDSAHKRFRASDPETLIASGATLEAQLSGRDPTRAQSSEEREARSQLVTALMKSAQLAEAYFDERGTAIDNSGARLGSDSRDQEVSKLQHQLTVGAARVAAMGGAYDLAERIAASRVLDETERTQLLDLVSAERNGGLDWRRERIGFILDDIAKGLGRADRAENAPSLTDYVYELVSYDEDQTVELLREALDPMMERAHEHEKTSPRPMMSLQELLAKGGDFDKEFLALTDFDTYAEMTNEDWHKWSQEINEGKRPVPLHFPVEWSAPEIESAVFGARVLARLERAKGRLETLASGLQAFQTIEIQREFVEAARVAGDDRLISELLMVYGSVNDSSRLSMLNRAFRSFSTELPPISENADATMLSSRARLLSLMGRHQEAHDLYDKAVQATAPANLDAIAKRGANLLHLNRYQPALQDFDKALGMEPGHPRLLLYRAKAYHGLGDYPSAIDSLEAGYERWPNSHLLHVQMAETLLVMGERVHASEYAMKASAIAWWGDYAVRRTRARVYAANFRYSSAIGDLNWLLTIDPYDMDVLEMRASLYSRRGDYSAAMQDCDRLIEADAGRASYYLLRAEARIANGGGKSQEVHRDIDYLLTLVPETSSMGQRAEVLNHLIRGQVQDVLSSALVASEQFPDEAWFLAEAAEAAYRMNLHPDAIDYATKALAIDGGNTRALSARGRAYRQTGRYPEALEDLSKQIALEGATRMTTFVSRGLTKKASGDPLGALSDFETALMISPTAVETQSKFPQLCYRESILILVNMDRFEEAEREAESFYEHFGDITQVFFLKQARASGQELIDLQDEMKKHGLIHSARSYQRRAYALHTLGRLDEIDAVWKEAESLHGDTLELQHEKAHYYKVTLDYEACRDFCEETLKDERFAGDPELRGQLASSLVELGLKKAEEYPEAKEEGYAIFEAMRKEGVLNLSAYYFYALSLHNEGKNEQAIQIAEEMSERFPKDHRPHFLIYLAADGLNDMPGVLKAALAYHKNAPWLTNGWRMVGTGYLRNGEHRTAISYLKEAISRPDVNSSAFLFLAEAYQGVKEYELAARSWRQALDNETNNALLAYNQLGSCLVILDQFSEAIRVLNEALAKYKSGNLTVSGSKAYQDELYAKIFYNLGLAYERLDSHDIRAVEAYRESARIYPVNHYVWERIAIRTWYLGLFEEHADAWAEYATQRAARMANRKPGYYGESAITSYLSDGNLEKALHWMDRYLKARSDASRIPRLRDATLQAMDGSLFKKEDPEDPVEAIQLAYDLANFVNLEGQEALESRVKRLVEYSLLRLSEEEQKSQGATFAYVYGKLAARSYMHKRYPESTQRYILRREATPLRRYRSYHQTLRNAYLQYNDTPESDSETRRQLVDLMYKELNLAADDEFNYWERVSFDKQLEPVRLDPRWRVLKNRFLAIKLAREEEQKEADAREDERDD